MAAQEKENVSWVIVNARLALEVTIAVKVSIKYPSVYLYFIIEFIFLLTNFIISRCLSSLM